MQPTKPWVLAGRSTSLFQMARRHGYNTAPIGYYLPYGKLLDGQLDYCLTVSQIPTGHGLPGKIAARYLELLDAIRISRIRMFLDEQFNRYWYRAGVGLLDQALGLIRRSRGTHLPSFICLPPTFLTSSIPMARTAPRPTINPDTLEVLDMLTSVSETWSTPSAGRANSRMRDRRDVGSWRQ